MDLILSVWDLLCICEGQKETVNNICTKKKRKEKRELQKQYSLVKYKMYERPLTLMGSNYYNYVKYDRKCIIIINYVNV
jgi:hypothetical protein